MDIKPRPNHKRYLLALIEMGEEKRYLKALELSAITKEVFKEGLRFTFPKKSETEINQLYIQRIAKCHNRNY